MTLHRGIRLLVPNRPILIIILRRRVVVPPKVEVLRISSLRNATRLVKIRDLLNHRGVITQRTRVARSTLTFCPRHDCLIDDGADEYPSRSVHSGIARETLEDEMAAHRDNVGGVVWVWEWDRVVWKRR